MIYIKSKLTIVFDNPFWYGVYEREYNQEYEVCKIIFGSEPKDYEVYEYLLSNSNKLIFSKPVAGNLIFEKRINPKRKQREIRKEIKTTSVGTKAQQAIKAHYEETKFENKLRKKLKKEEEKELKFKLRKIKRKAKHKGH